MDVSLPMHHALFSTCDHSHEMQQMGVLSLAYGGRAGVGGGDIRPRRRSIQDIQPQGMDVVVSLAR